MDKNNSKTKTEEEEVLGKEEEKEEDIEKLEEVVEEQPEEKVEDTQIDNRENELEEQLKRAVADYRNLERRIAEEKVQAIKFANRHLIEELLPAFDTLILAGKYTEDESVKLTIKHLLEVLKNNGIEKVETDGAKYNAETMEAVVVVEGEDGKVIEEIRPGFTINGRLIRPAQVKVGGAKKE